MIKLETLALPSVAAACAVPFAAQTAGFAAFTPAMSAAPFLLASATLFVPGLFLILGLLRRNRPVAAAA